MFAYIFSGMYPPLHIYGFYVESTLINIALLISLSLPGLAFQPHAILDH